MRKHNIIISTYDELQNPYYAGGGAVAIDKITHYLQEDYAITVICGKYPGYKDYKKGNVLYKHIGSAKVSGRLSQLLYSFCLPFYAMTLPFDIWIESFTPPFSTACIPLFTKKKVIALVHMLSGEDMKRKYKIPFDLLEKIGLHLYNYFIVLTNNDAEKIKNICPHARRIIIPNGVDMPLRRAIKKEKHILFVGRIEVNQKGLDLLIQAYAIVARKSKYPLVIAGTGTGDQLAQLKEIINKYHIDDKVTLIGKVGIKKKEQLYSEALCVVIPSRFETFSLVALETLSFGKSLVTFSIKGLSWLPKNMRVEVPQFDITKMSRAIMRLAKDKKERTLLGRNGRLFAKKYTWETIAKQYKKEIEMTLSERSTI